MRQTRRKRDSCKIIPVMEYVIIKCTVAYTGNSFFDYYSINCILYLPFIYICIE